jgi:hypothetical protein
MSNATAHAERRASGAAPFVAGTPVSMCVGVKDPIAYINRRSPTMYIGVGAIVVILIIVAVVMLARR